MKKLLILLFMGITPSLLFSQAITLDPNTSPSEIKVEREDIGKAFGVITGRLGIHPLFLNSVVLSSNNFPLTLSTGAGSNNFDLKINPGGDIGVGDGINNSPWSDNINSNYNLIKAKLHVEGVSPRNDGIPLYTMAPIKPSIYGYAKPRSGETETRNLVGVFGATNGGNKSGGENIGVLGVGSLSTFPESNTINFYSAGKIENSKSLVGFYNYLDHYGTGSIYGNYNIIHTDGSAYGAWTILNSYTDGTARGQSVNVIKYGSNGSLYNYYGNTTDNSDYEESTFGIYSLVNVNSTKYTTNYLGAPVYNNGYAVRGVATGSSKAGKYGVYGEALGTQGTKYGVYGAAQGGGTNYAGYFSGNVHVTNSLSKGSGSFKIDHPLDPENKYLYHSFVESPDMMNIYNGNVVTDSNGNATIELPVYFNALNRDFRYQLTTIGQKADAWIAEEVSESNIFKISTDKPNVKVSWQVTGIRQDAHANANRIIPEVDKPMEEKGLYLDPKSMGKPETMGLNYKNEKEDRLKVSDTEEMSKARRRN